MIASTPDLLPLATMMVLLAAIGWGLGMAAALARRSISARGPGHVWVSSPFGVCLAVVVAAGALGGYALVLRAIGLVSY